MQRIFPNYINNDLAQADGLELSDIYGTPELNFPLAGVPLIENEAARRPYVYFNMVSSVDGKSTTQADNAEGLGTRTDRQLMQRLRLASDAVLIGASTFRRDPFVPDTSPDYAAERQQYFPHSPHPLGLVLSSDGNLPLDNKFFRAERCRRVIFLGPQATPETERNLTTRARVFRLGADNTGRPDLQQLLQIAFLELKIQRLLVEGGATLNYSFISNGWADELFWTLAPKIVGGSLNPGLVEGPGKGFDPQQLPQLQLTSIYAQGSELFMRYKFKVRLK